MKYISYFNEKVKSSDILEFCNSHLAFLKDNNFSFYVDNDYGTIQIRMHKTNRSGPNYYVNWADVRDELQPFFELLNIKYNIKDIYFSNFSTKPRDIRDWVNLTISEINDIPYYAVFNGITIILYTKSKK